VQDFLYLLSRYDSSDPGAAAPQALSLAQMQFLTLVDRQTCVPATGESQRCWHSSKEHQLSRLSTPPFLDGDNLTTRAFTTTSVSQAGHIEPISQAV